MAAKEHPVLDAKHCVPASVRGPTWGQDWEIQTRSTACDQGPLRQPVQAPHPTTRLAQSARHVRGQPGRCIKRKEIHTRATCLQNENGGEENGNNSSKVWGRHFKPAPLREWIWLNHVHATNRTLLGDLLQKFQQSAVGRVVPARGSNGNGANFAPMTVSASASKPRASGSSMGIAWSSPEHAARTACGVCRKPDRTDCSEPERDHGRMTGWRRHRWRADDRGSTMSGASKGTCAC